MINFMSLLFQNRTP